MGSRVAALFAFMLDVEFTELSDPGRVRGHNEDFLGHASPVTPAQANTHGWVFALADGVGGNDYGEVASRTAVETLLSGFHAAPAGEPPGALLSRLVKDANSRILEIGMSNASSGRKMATTLVACALRHDRLVVAHVGDSRCYLVRRGHTTALTRDHTLVAEQVRLGVLSAKEAAESLTKHLLSRSLGSELFVSVDTSEHQIHVGDVLLLCSDGLHGSLEPKEIADLLGHSSDLQIAAQKLVAIANERDGSDNISVQLIRVRGVERVGMYRGRPYKLR
jgi:serine/threonine protein phosphatase PrpC